MDYIKEASLLRVKFRLLASEVVKYAEQGWAVLIEQGGLGSSAFAGSSKAYKKRRAQSAFILTIGTDSW